SYLPLFPTRRSSDLISGIVVHRQLIAFRLKNNFTGNLLSFHALRLYGISRRKGLRTILSGAIFPNFGVQTCDFQFPAANFFWAYQPLPCWAWAVAPPWQNKQRPSLTR